MGVFGIAAVLCFWKILIFFNFKLFFYVLDILICYVKNKF
jgi:hypothetical protein